MPGYCPGLFSSSSSFWWLRSTRFTYCSSVGTRAPAYAGPNQLPASSRAISAAVKSFTFQGDRSGKTSSTSVVRARLSSCRTTSSPSRVRWTSFSTQRMPSSAARSTAASVFSGAYPEAPRWATTVGPSSPAPSVRACERSREGDSKKGGGRDGYCAHVHAYSSRRTITDSTTVTPERQQREVRSGHRLNGVAQLRSRGRHNWGEAVILCRRTVRPFRWASYSLPRP